MFFIHIISIMVNIHIAGDKSHFKSKNSVNRLKNKIKELGDPNLVINSDFLQEGYEFKFKEEKDDIFVEIQKQHYLWGDMNAPRQENNQPKQQKTDSELRLKQKLNHLKSERTGSNLREMKFEEKNVDKKSFIRYNLIKKMSPSVPIKKPSELLGDPEKNRQEIQIFSTGLVKISGDKKLDDLIGEYFKGIAELTNIEIPSEQEIKALFDQNNNKVETRKEEAANIQLNSYVDSDTESESSDVEDVELK